MRELTMGGDQHINTCRQLHTYNRHNKTHDGVEPFIENKGIIPSYIKYIDMSSMVVDHV